jgi:hypothetical protein
MSNTNNKQIYIEQHPNGYSVSLGGAKRASTVEATQKEAIEKAKEMHPNAPIHVERVRNTSNGHRDK